MPVRRSAAYGSAETHIFSLRNPGGGIGIHGFRFDILKKGILLEGAGIAVLLGFFFFSDGKIPQSPQAAIDAATGEAETGERDKEPIKWVDFTVSYDALCQAYEWDVKTHGTEHETDWVTLLAYTAAKTGGKFDKQACLVLEKGAKALAEGEETVESLTEEMKYYPYYEEAYRAVLGGLVGEYREEAVSETGQRQYETKYGLKGCFPLARGFDYSHYDDFGAGRSYGYKRRHLGHDMMGLIGTPTRIKNGIRK